jgi:S-formylglutathione hydrolase FrmB
LLAALAACGGSTPSSTTPDSSAGATGTAGATSSAGATGSAGATSSAGATGSAGATSSAGATGSAGATSAPDAAAGTTGTSDAAAPDGGAGSTGATDAAALPAPQPRGYPAGSAPRIESKSFAGPISKTTIGFQVYLPPGYDSSTTTRYPTVYDLHGLTGSQFEDPQWVVPSLEAAMKKNLIGPVIVVFPDGLVESYYADSKDGKKPSETRILKDLIPHVDATYRTVAHRHLRAVTGFSMGGYGAMELATKFPDVFVAGVAYDAALDTWQTLTMRRASIATATFGDDESWFNAYSPWENAKKNGAALSVAPMLRLVPGTTYQMFDSTFKAAMAAIPVPLDYVETTCPHDYGCALNAQGAQSWTFIEAAFDRK